MSENYYQVVSDIYCMTLQMITGVGFSALYRTFFGKAPKTWLVGGTYFAVTAVLYYVPFLVDNFTVYSAAIFAAFLVMLVCGRDGLKMKIFLAATFFSIRWFTVSIVNDIVRVLSDFVVGQICEADISDGEKYRMLFVSFCWHDVLECAVFGLVLWGSVRAVGRAFSGDLKGKRIDNCNEGIHEKDMQTAELCVLLIPSVLGIVCYKIYRMYDDIFSEQTGRYVQDVYSALSVWWTIGKMILLGAIFCMIVLYQKLKEKQVQEKKALLLAGQIQDMQAHIAEVERLYTEIRGVKHDVRSHVGVLAGLLDRGADKEAGQYLKQWQETVAALDYSIQTGNPVTDVILNEKAAEAAAGKIRFGAEFHYPSGTKLNVFDVSILLNNAIDNALRAAGEGGFVRVRAKRSGNAYLIEIANSFEGELLIGENGLPVTGGDSERHGFGTQNMKLIAQKYFGDIEIEQREGEVVVTALLMCE